MKDIVRLLGYSLGSIAVILLLINLATSESISSGFGIFMAILLVVVAPVVIGIMKVNREKRKEALGEQE